jgi:hypothetical protein
MYQRASPIIHQRINHHHQLIGEARKGTRVPPAQFRARWPVVVVR